MWYDPKGAEGSGLYLLCTFTLFKTFALQSSGLFCCILCTSRRITSDLKAVKTRLYVSRIKVRIRNSFSSSGQLFLRYHAMTEAVLLSMQRMTKGLTNELDIQPLQWCTIPRGVLLRSVLSRSVLGLRGCHCASSPDASRFGFYKTGPGVRVAIILESQFFMGLCTCCTWPTAVRRGETEPRRHSVIGF